MLSINNKVEVKESYEWIESSFKVFREKPINFILLMLVNIIFGILPVINGFLGPIFTAKYASLTKSILNNQPIETFNFREIFRNKSIMRLSLISGIFSFLFLFNSFLPKLGFLNNNLLIFPFSFKLIISLIFYSFYVFIMLAMYFAPIICLNEKNMDVFDSLKLSFKAGLSNIIPLLFYFIIMLALVILGVITLGLGLLIVIPMINISTYFIYKSILVNDEIVNDEI